MQTGFRFNPEMRARAVRAISSAHGMEWIGKNIELREKYMRPGQSSLHLASGYSMLPVVEVLYGLNVSTTDVELSAIMSGFRQALSILRRNAPELWDEVAKMDFSRDLSPNCVDLFELSPATIPANMFHHVTMTNFFKCANFVSRPYEERMVAASNIFEGILFTMRDKGILTVTADDSMPIQFSVYEILKEFLSRGVSLEIVGWGLPANDHASDSMIIKVHKSPQFYPSKLD